MSELGVLDAHAHFWDPSRLEYPWLEQVPSLLSACLPTHYDRAMTGIPIEGILFVEGNPRPDLFLDEVEFVEELAVTDPRILGIVAFADLLDRAALPHSLDRLAARSLVRGVRHNIQGHEPGFAVQPAFVAGVREVGSHGLTFDLCATHDQLVDAISLARRVPGTRMALDHCGKPPIRAGGWEPWASDLEELAALPNVYCKISGLLTEADPTRWRGSDLFRYAEHVLKCFGAERIMYGSDWPVLTLADRSAEWYSFAREWSAGWSTADRKRFFGGNAGDFYRL